MLKFNPVHILFTFAVPVEWLVMVADISAMPLINDLRQTMFVGILLSFGIILIGEHLSVSTLYSTGFK